MAQLIGWRSNVSILALGIVFALLLLALSAERASAVTCYGDYCSGKDPQASGCSTDAVTVASKSVEGGKLDLRWSNRCKTNWARWQQYPPRIATPVPIQIRAVQDTGYTQRKNIADSSGYAAAGTYWTPMIYSPVHKVRAEATLTCAFMTLGECTTNVLLGGNLVRTAWV